MKYCFVLKYFSFDEYTFVLSPLRSLHITSAFPLNVTDRESIWQSLSTSTVTWPETQSPLVKVLPGFAAGSYETLRLFTVFDMVSPRRGTVTECTRNRRGCETPVVGVASVTLPCALSLSLCEAVGVGVSLGQHWAVLKLYGQLNGMHRVFRSNL